MPLNPSFLHRMGWIYLNSLQLAVWGFSSSGTGTSWWMQKRHTMESLCSIGLLGCETVGRSKQRTTDPRTERHPPQAERRAQEYGELRAKVERHSPT